MQLDYYMSAQFAGIALACRRGIYEKAGLKVNLLLGLISRVSLGIKG